MVIIILTILLSISGNSAQSYDKIQNSVNVNPPSGVGSGGGKNHAGEKNGPENEEPVLNKSTNNSMNSNKETRKDLLEIRANSHNELNHLINYISFGILIAIFYMSSQFRRKNRDLVTIVSLCAVISVALNFYLTSWMKNKSTDLFDKTEGFLDKEYIEFYSYCNSFFKMHTLFVAVLVMLFLWLGFRYLFFDDVKNKVKSS